MAGLTLNEEEGEKYLSSDSREMYGGRRGDSTANQGQTVSEECIRTAGETAESPGPEMYSVDDMWLGIKDWES